MRQPARDAAIVEVQRLGAVVRLLTAGPRVHGDRRALSRVLVQERDPSVRRIDHDRGTARRLAVLDPVVRRTNAAAPFRIATAATGSATACSRGTLDDELFGI